MREKKTYIVLIVVIVVFFLVMFALFGVQGIKEGNQENVLLVGNDTIWLHSKGKWYNVTSKSSVSKMNWNKFNVFLDNKKVGSYNMWHDDKWYAFDDKSNAIILDGKFFAYKANYNIDVYNYELSDIDSSDSYVFKVLDDNNLSSSSVFKVASKLSFDFDNDGVVEDFYIISNAFSSEDTGSDRFSIVFMVKNDTIYNIYREINRNADFYTGCIPSINTILDINSDNKYEFIISCAQYSVSGQVDMLYKFSNNEFKILISNQ